MARRRPSRKREAELSQVFSCLGDPTRRQILGLLQDAGELRVGDVAAAFEMSLNGVSKHLKVLESAGLVGRRVEGQSHFLSARPDGLALARTYLDDRLRFWADRLDTLEELFTGGDHD